MNSPPRWSWHLDEGRPAILVIEDLFDESDPCMTVTNGAEYVVENTVESLGYVPAACIYRDTDGCWDELLIDPGSGKFAGFRHCGGETEVEALALIRSKYNAQQTAANNCYREIYGRGDQ